MLPRLPDPEPIVFFALLGFVAFVVGATAFVVWAAQHIRFEWVQ